MLASASVYELDFSALERRIVELANPSYGGVALINYGPSVEFLFKPSGELVWADFSLFTNAENPQRPSDIGKSYMAMHYGVNTITEAGESQTKSEAMSKPQNITALQVGLIGEKRCYLERSEGPQPVDFESFSRFSSWYETLPLKEIVTMHSVDSPQFYLFSSNFNFLLKEEIASPDINIIYLDCTTPEIKEVTSLSIELEPALDDPRAKYVSSVEFRDYDYCLIEPYYIQTESKVGINEISAHGGKIYTANNIIVLLRSKE